MVLLCLISGISEAGSICKIFLVVNKLDDVNMIQNCIKPIKEKLNY